MTDESEDTLRDFVQERFHNQLEWYVRKSFQQRRLAVGLQMSQVLLLAAIPPLLIFFDVAWSTAAASVLAIGALVIATYQQVARPDSQWEQSRLIQESLKREYFMYQTGAGDYAGQDERRRHTRFIRAIESILSAEHSLWFLGEAPPSKRHREG